MIERERNQKVHILLATPSEHDTRVIAVFDNESAAHESRELMQEEDCEKGTEFKTFFTVITEPVRMNKLNKATREAKL